MSRQAQPRRLLLVCGNFPPSAAVGARRPWSLVRHLPPARWCSDVVALGPDDPTLPLPTGAHVTRVQALQPLQRLARRVRGRGTGAGGKASTPYRTLFYPDGLRGMILPALRAALRIHRARPVDVVYTTGPKWSAVIAARLAARALGVPCVVEFRDLLYGRHLYTGGGPLATRADRLLEDWIVGGSDLVVAVSPTAADVLRARHPDARVVTVPVGFDPDDGRTRQPAATGPFTLVHAGTLYGLKRDPGPLFAAIAASDLAPEALRVHFIGSESHLAAKRAAELGVAPFVHTTGPVPRAEALAAVQEAHALLALIYDHPDETTAIPAKIYEYLGMGGPLLVLGPATNPTRELVRRHPQGLYSIDPAAIGAWLQERVRSPRAPVRRADSLADLGWDVLVPGLAAHLDGL